MPRPVNHDERKRRIVAESVKLFARFGFSETNFGMIAAKSGISRTLLYTYFKDKREIFNAAIDEVTSRIAIKHIETMRSHESVDTKLREICAAVFAMLFENRDFVCVIADVLTSYRRSGSIPIDKVKRHTAGMKRILVSLLEEAVARGEYRADLSIERAAELIYSQFEASVLRLALTGGAEIGEAIDRMNGILSAVKAPVRRANVALTYNAGK